jgi:hypothetical protein
MEPAKRRKEHPDAEPYNKALHLKFLNVLVKEFGRILTVVDEGLNLFFDAGM